MFIDLSTLSHWGFVTVAYGVALGIIALLIIFAEGRQRRLRRLHAQLATHHDACQNVSAPSQGASFDR